MRLVDIDMIIKLLASQIPEQWELIKYCAVKADEIDKELLQPYLNDLLHLLLNNNAQCWIRLNDGREVIGLMITQIAIDKIYVQKFLSIKCVYSFKAVPLETWEQDFSFLKKFVKKEQCEYIIFHSRNKKIWELGEMSGFRETFRSFEFCLKE